MKIRRALTDRRCWLARTSPPAAARRSPAPATTPPCRPRRTRWPAAFAASFAAGDTPTACALAGGLGAAAHDRSGWCQQSPGWSTGYWSGAHCQLGDAEQFTADVRTTPTSRTHRSTGGRVSDFLVGVQPPAPRTGSRKVTLTSVQPAPFPECQLAALACNQMTGRPRAPRRGVRGRCHGRSAGPTDVLGCWPWAG